MKCRNCHTEVNENEQQCTNCGAPLHNDNDEPTIGRGLVIFIVIGTIFLVGFGFFYYFNHMHDPKYTLTSIEPDSNLAEKNAVKLDTIALDTLNKDSLDKEEAKQAEKVLNSIRGKRNKHNSRNNKEEQDEEVDPVTVPSNPDGGNTTPDVAPIAPTVSKPRVEKIEVKQLQYAKEAFKQLDEAEKQVQKFIDEKEGEK